MTLTSLEEGYAALAESEAKWISRGRTPVGYKVGLTNAAAQQHFGADGPCFGRLFADMGTPDGGTIEVGRYSRPLIEAEIAFRIGPRGAEELIPALEIVESRYAKGPSGIAELIADNVSGAGFVFGSPIPFEGSFDFEGCGVAVARNGIPECQGVGSSCLGSPLRSLEWLAEELDGRDRGLGPGDVVLAGSLIVPFEARAGDEIRADFEGLGSVSVQFAEEA